jgi:serine protease
MRIRCLLAAAAAVASLTGPSALAADAAVVPGRVIVRYHGDTTHAERVRAQVRSDTATEGVIAGGARELRVAGGHPLSRTIDELNRDPAVAYAVPDYVVHAADFIPRDPGRSGVAGGWQQVQWNFTGPASVNAPAAWTLARRAGAPGGRGVTVAVIDSGVAYESYRRFRRAPDLYGTRFVRGYDWVSRDRHPNDEEGHGTHVTGTIAETTNNRRALTGLAYGVRIMPLRVLDRDGNGSGADIARAIRWAAKHGAKVINMSVEFDSGERAGDIPEVIRAIGYANRKGAVMVAASGNEGVQRIAYPARADHVISVGATTADGCLATYSNAGRGLDVVAPGGGQDAPLGGNAWDDTHCNPVRRDRLVYQQTFWGSVRRFGLVGFEGTSFSTPHVSAIAALVIATRRIGRHPSPAAVRRRIMDTAQDVGPAGNDPRYGAGLADAAAALRR